MGWAIPSETSSTRLRQKTLCLARNTYNIANIIGGVLEPYPEVFAPSDIRYMINPTNWDWKGKAAFFWGVSCLITTIWAYFRLPEARGRTFEELDILFEKRVSARKFRGYDVDAYADSDNLLSARQ